MNESEEYVESWNLKKLARQCLINAGLIYKEAKSEHDRNLERLWFLSNSKEPFSFSWCCELAGLNPSTLKRGIGL